MGTVGEYIISVTSAALVCGCVQSFFDGKGPVSSVLKLLCGIFLCVVALRPVMDIRLPELAVFSQEPRAEAGALAAEAQQLAAEAQRERISEECRTYIAQKAQTLGCDLSIRVYTGQEAPYAPSRVEIEGNASPYARGVLTNWITENLAVKAEDQRWIG